MPRHIPDRTLLQQNPVGFTFLFNSRLPALWYYGASFEDEIMLQVSLELERPE